MLNFAMVLMILAGIFGLPAVMCSGICSAMETSAIAETGRTDSGIMQFFLYLAAGASLGSIIVGAMVKKLRKVVSGTAALIFALCFASLLFQLNVLGGLSSAMLVVAAIMIFVAPAEQFSNIQKVKTVD